MKIIQKLPTVHRYLFRYFLKAYRSRDAAQYQRARIQLIFLGTGMLVFTLFLAQDLLVSRSTEWVMYVSCLGGTFFLLGLGFVLRTGRYLLSGHLLLGSSAAIIWFWMFFASVNPLNRLDTVMVLIAALTVAPLITNKTGLVIHFSANGILHLLFLRFNPESENLSASVLMGYGLDTTVAFFMSGTICYLLIKISERTEREIQRSSSRLENLVRRQTAALRRTSAELEASRDKLHHDMDMARQVQASLLIHEAPALAGWSLAHAYLPCSLVSGDFYDFYTRGDRLDGVGLFDVSGHGVSSGLITVLARAIFYRKFYDLTHESLSHVIGSANEELMAELKNVNNYLTGLLVRCQDATIETVNAGHADPILCDSAGNTREIGRGDGTHRGTFLGKDFLIGEYPTQRTKVEPGDAVLIYSDGITDSFNSHQEAYGRARLRRALAASGHLSRASERLDAILDDLHRFNEGVPLTDDLSMILLLKR